MAREKMFEYDDGLTGRIEEWFNAAHVENIKVFSEGSPTVHYVVQIIGNNASFQLVFDVEQDAIDYAHLWRDRADDVC